MTRFRRITLVGPGLLGGSLGMALRALPEPPQVRAWARRAETIAELQAGGCVDSASEDLNEAVDGADLIVLATPVGVMPELAQQVADCAGFDAATVVTDVGSVKRCVVEKLEPVFDGAGRGCFVGSHPMAGSEKTGVAASRADLFEGATCLLTPSETTDRGALQRVDEFWQALGMKTLQFDAGEHDRSVARISHLPHLNAAALVMAALDEDATLAALAGPGFRDSTRIAGGPPQMWAEILLENREAVAEELRRLQAQLGETLAFLDKVNEEDLRRYLAEAKRRRDLFSAAIDS